MYLFLQTLDLFADTPVPVDGLISNSCMASGGARSQARSPYIMRPGLDTAPKGAHAQIREKHCVNLIADPKTYPLWGTYDFGQSTGNYNGELALGLLFGNSKGCGL